MKRLIMCEGSNELALINILLDNDDLIITEDEFAWIRSSMLIIMVAIRKN